MYSIHIKTKYRSVDVLHIKNILILNHSDDYKYKSIYIKQWYNEYSQIIRNTKDVTRETIQLSRRSLTITEGKYNYRKMIWALMFCGD